MCSLSVRRQHSLLGVLNMTSPYMPSCMTSKSGLLLDQHSLCSDCEKIYYNYG